MEIYLPDFISFYRFCERKVMEIYKLKDMYIQLKIYADGAHDLMIMRTLTPKTDMVKIRSTATIEPNRLQHNTMSGLMPCKNRYWSSLKTMHAKALSVKSLMKGIDR